MLRVPAPQSGETPTCFGLRRAPDVERCVLCPVQDRCRSAMGEWSSSESVYERCRNLEAESQTPRLEVALQLEVIYDAEYRRIFGRAPRRKRTHRNDLIFSRTLAYLLREGIDPATYVAANMTALKDAPVVRKHGFQPNMISGDAAKIRYNDFLRAANAKYRRGLSDVTEAGSALGVLRRSLFDGEQVVAELFVRTRWTGFSISWDDAIRRADPNEIWRSIKSSSGETYAHWSPVLGSKGIAREIRLAELRACVAVLDSLLPGLSRRVACRDVDVDWLSVANFLVRTFDPPKPRQYDLSGIPGDLWG